MWQEYELLQTALQRVLATYSIVEKAVEESKRPFPTDGSGDNDLRDLWKLLKPESDLPALTGKHWQEVRCFLVLDEIVNSSNSRAFLNLTSLSRSSARFPVSYSSGFLPFKADLKSGSCTETLRLRQIFAESEYSRKSLSFHRCSREIRSLIMFHISLQSLLYFARTFSERAVEIVDEAVNGGLNW